MNKTKTNVDQDQERLREDRFYSIPLMVNATFNGNDKLGSMFISKWYDNFVEMHQNGDLAKIDTEYSRFLPEVETRYEHYLKRFPDNIKKNPKNKGHMYKLYKPALFGYDCYYCSECISFPFLYSFHDGHKCIQCFDCFKEDEGKNIRLYDKYLQRRRRKNLNTLLNIDLLKAAQRGIQYEGMAIGEEQETKLIYEKLNKIIHRDVFSREVPRISNHSSKLPWRARVNADELRELCVGLYTKNSFLYEIVNKSIRDQDMSKCDTLGPFCYLLYDYTNNQTKQRIPKTVYRGVTFTRDQINSYKRSDPKTYKKWIGFTSTSKNYKKVQKFGNTLFVINLCCPYWRIGADISSVSYSPEEEEVLLPDGVMFKIMSVDDTRSKTDKCIIYLKIDRKIF